MVSLELASELLEVCNKILSWGDHAGWDKVYNLKLVKLNFLLVMDMARIFPEEGRGQKCQRQKIFHLVSARYVVFTDT